MATVGLIGHPAGHSKSPAAHKAVFEAVGIDWEFELFDLVTDKKAREFIRAADYIGLSVTTPYKPLAAHAVDICSASAKLAKGANVIVNRKGTLLGSNVDGRGAVTYLEHFGVSFAGATVGVCGTGPTALSCLHAAALAGADTVILLSRNKQRAQQVLQEYLDLYSDLSQASINPPAAQGRRSFREAFEQVRFLFGGYLTSLPAIEAADIVIDATTLGMREDDPAPFDTSALHAGQTVFDVCYMRPTALLRQARAQGCATFDGRAMLLGQCAIVQDLWFEAQDFSCPLSWDERVSLMVQAAGFAD
ncbi:MAG: shikimate dehydrogenase family protein [Eggerthellaceae bacterium]|jgi:shikimate 5-dehydrogenase